MSTQIVVSWDDVEDALDAVRAHFAAAGIDTSEWRVRRRNPALVTRSQFGGERFLLSLPASGEKLVAALFGLLTVNPRVLARAL